MADSVSAMRNPRAILSLVLWFVFSGFTLFINKYVVSILLVDAMLLGFFQVLMTLICGFVQRQVTARSAGKSQQRPPNYFFNMIVIGLLTSGVILFGLAALSFVAVSFAETVKSSAPIVTVLVSWLVLGESTPVLVSLSLLPVMLGLAVCSMHELSFSMAGLVAAMSTNVCECLQSVFVKKMLSNNKYSYSTAELQLWPGVVGVCVQGGAVIVLLCWRSLSAHPPLSPPPSPSTVSLLVVAGICYYLQTVSAYVLIHYITPVTYSVANTVKRALLIWLSLLLFHNQLTVASAVGTALVFCGVFVYNVASHRSAVARTAQL